MRPGSTNVRRYTAFLTAVARACGALAAAIGATILVAWLGGAAQRWSASGALTMKTNMALSLLLAGVALVLVEPGASPPARRSGGILGGLVLLMGALTLGEHVFGWNLGIDQLVATEAPGAVGTGSPNRFGIPGAMSLALVGAGLILAAGRRPAAAYLGLATCAVAIVPAIGFLYGVGPFYSHGARGIAWPTVVALLLLGLGLGLYPRDRSPFAILWRDDPGGELVRRLMLPSILIPLFLGYLRLQGERLGAFSASTGHGLYGLVLIVMLSALLWRSARQLSALALLRQRAADRLARDAQELRRAREHAEWLASFPARNPVPIAEVDADGQVRYANAAAERLLPGLREAATQHPWLAGWRDVVDIFSAKGATSHARTVVVGEATYEQLMYSVPETQCIRIYAIDVTHRVRAEAALRESEQRLRALADSMPQLAWTAAPDGYITWYNRRWYEYTGTTPEQMEGWGWQAVHDPATLPGVLRRWKECIASGAPFEMEFPLRRADGQFRRFLTRGFPLKSGSGAVIQWFGTNTDVTELVEAQDALREAARRKDEFLGMLSHELRNPLAPIRSSAYVLERAPAASDQAAHARAVIKRQIEHLARLVDDLLDVTRIARGKLTVHPSRVELGALASASAEDFRHLLNAKDVAFRVALPDAEVWADADATRVSQALGNLLHNAAKFTRPGDVVTLSLRASGDEAKLSVTDTGSGIDATLLDHVFDPFVQGNGSLARTQGGLGLGLAIVKAVAELHGGSVRAESAGSGQGARFELRLPLAPSASRPRAAPARAEPLARSRRVLVVDDNRDAAESLALVVTLLGHHAEVAFDGAGAIDKVRGDAFDAVLCDLGLPGMTGYEVATRLRAERPDRLTLIAVSGYAQPEDVQRAIEAGFDGHVAKPCSPSDIERLLA